MTVNGNIQGHQQQCMRHKVNNVPCNCNMSYDNCMKAGHVCKPFKMEPITNLREEFIKNESGEALNSLERLCIVPGVQNAWNAVNFGENKRGIFIATPVCLLHTFLLRFCSDVFDVFLEMNGKTSKAKKSGN